MVSKASSKEIPIAIPVFFLSLGVGLGAVSACSTSSNETPGSATATQSARPFSGRENSSAEPAVAKEGAKLETPPKEGNLSERDQKKIEEYQIELELGRNMAGRLVTLSPPYANKPLVDYVNEVGLYVAGYSDFPERRYMFEVLDDDSVNAYACPGGYILVTLGALRLVENESELALILGHEIAHVGRQHVLKALKLRTSADKETPKENPADIAARARPAPPRSALAETLARHLMGPGGVGLSIFQAVDIGMKMILQEGLDQKLEFEADREGARAAIKAGYDGRAMLQFFEHLKARKSALNTKTLEKTHPKVEDRQKNLNELMDSLKAQGPGALGKERFAKFKALIRPEKAKPKR